MSFNHYFSIINICKLLQILIFIQISFVLQLYVQQSIPHGMTLIRNKHAYMADKGLLSSFLYNCISDHPYENKKTNPSSQSLENLIDYIERLEEVLSNTTDPILQKFKNLEDVARLILHRFHLEEIDFNTMEQLDWVQKRSDIDTKIIGTSKLIEMDYYFPDYIYDRQELCTMLFMFSHFFLNKTDVQLSKRYRRGTYIIPENSKNHLEYSIQEKGVVTFRLDKTEAIAPAKLLIGILVGLTKNLKVQAKDLFPNSQLQLVLKDPLLVTTLANIPGSAIFFDNLKDLNSNENLIFGIKGKWIGPTYEYYAIDQHYYNNIPLDKLRKYNRGSLAQIRGALDGYIIGKNLRKLFQTSSTNHLKLSNILRSYYSMPRGQHNDLGFNYCDRSQEKPDINSLVEEANIYSELMKYIGDMEGAKLKTDIFSSILDQATTVTESDFCRNRPTGNLDKNSPCETPADLIFVIDPKHESLMNSLSIISEILSKTNKIGKYAGTFSVFLMTNTKNDVHLPSPGGWPMPALIFNSTNIGSILNAFKQEKMNFASQSNFGRFFKELNQTIFNYKWWSPRRFMAGVPSKNVIVIDYDTLKYTSDSTDRSDYDYFKDELKYQNPDVGYFVFSNNRKYFADILKRKDNDIFSPNQRFNGFELEKKICDNPATLIFNDCYVKVSDGQTYNGFITPYYKQNWAMYPEYFHQSHNIEITIKSYNGVIKYCYDRQFPPEWQENCKEIQMNGEEKLYISNPCHHETVRSCRPIYITIWGKSGNNIPCNDVACQSLDQIKFSISHKGVSCNSSIKIGAFVLLQIICFLLTYISYNYFV